MTTKEEAVAIISDFIYDGHDQTTPDAAQVQAIRNAEWLISVLEDSGIRLYSMGDLAQIVFESVGNTSK